jgi:hypothetical protein
MGLIGWLDDFWMSDERPSNGQQIILSGGFQQAIDEAGPGFKVLTIMSAADGDYSVGAEEVIDEKRVLPLFQIVGFESGPLDNKDLEDDRYVIEHRDYYFEALLEMYLTTQMPEGRDVIRDHIGGFFIYILKSHNKRGAFDANYQQYLDIYERFLQHIDYFLQDPVIIDKNFHLFKLMNMILKTPKNSEYEYRSSFEKAGINKTARCSSCKVEL